MMSYLKAHSEDFQELMDLATADKQPYSWRAAWLLSSCVDQNEALIREHIPAILARIEVANDSQKRDLIRVLLEVEVPEEVEGQLFDICINIWSKVNKIPSVRYSAIRLAIRIAERHPDLIQEIDIVTQEHFVESLSPGTKRSLLKILRKLKNV